MTTLLLSNRRAMALAIACVPVLAVTACSGGDGDTAPAPTITVAGPSAALTVEPGASATATLAVTRGGGFGGPVTLAASDLPAGITATLEPSTLAPTATQSAVTTTVGADVAPGSYSYTVTTSGAGVRTVRTTVPVTVRRGATPAGSIALSGPATLAVTQGAAVTATYTLARTNFTGDVTLTAENVPAGVTATFVPATLTGTATTSTLTLAAGPGAAAGAQAVTVRARGTGVADASAPAAVTVAPAAPSGSVVTLRFCEAHAPVWVGFQSADGAWTRATASGAHTYTATIAGRGGVAYVERSTGDAAHVDLTVAYGSTAELQTIGGAFCARPAPVGKEVNGTVAGVGADQFANVALGSAFTTVLPSLGTSFTLKQVPDGALDLVATRGQIDETTETLSVDRVILRRGLNPAAGSTLPVLDFGAAEAFAPARATLTIGALGADTATNAVGLFTGTLGTGIFSFGSDLTAPASYAGLPADRLLAGELQFLTAAADAAGDSKRSRGAFLFFREVTNRTVTLGAPLASVQVTAAGTSPYLRARAQFEAQSDYGAFAQVSFDQDTRSAEVSVTQAYLGGAAARWELAVPDLSGAAGFDPAWGLRPETATRWSASAYGGDIGVLLGGRPAEGLTMRYASRDGTAFGGAALARATAHPAGLLVRTAMARPPAPRTLARLRAQLRTQRTGSR